MGGAEAVSAAESQLGGQPVASRAPALAVALAISSHLLAALLAQSGGVLAAAVPASSVEFQDGAGNIKQSFSPGDTASFYIRDVSLDTVVTSTVTWTGVAALVTAGTPWSLATGAPQTPVYALSDGSIYDTSTPSNTPLRSLPTAFVNNTEDIVTNFDSSTGEIELLHNVDQSSTLRVDFAFDVVDSYSAGQHRANVSSTSDTDGEWVAIAEVVSETDAGASPTSGLFRGQVVVSDNAEASASGDGAVWVRRGDKITVTYYDSDGATVIDTHQANVVFPVPVPTTGWPTLALLAVAFGVAIAWRLGSHPVSDRGR